MFIHVLQNVITLLFFLVVEEKNKCSIVYADKILAFPVTCKILQCFVNQNAKEKNVSFTK